MFSPPTHNTTLYSTILLLLCTPGTLCLCCGRLLIADDFNYVQCYYFIIYILYTHSTYRYNVVGSIWIKIYILIINHYISTSLYPSRHTNSGIIYTRIGVIFARFFTFLRTYRSLMFWFFLNYHGVGSTLIPELM